MLINDKRSKIVAVGDRFTFRNNQYFEVVSIVPPDGEKQVRGWIELRVIPQDDNSENSDSVIK